LKKSLGSVAGDDRESGAPSQLILRNPLAAGMAWIGPGPPREIAVRNAVIAVAMST